MNAIVKSTCGTCGDVELKPDQLELRICSVPNRSVYAFTCPSCRISIIKPAADRRIVNLLRSVGVSTVGWAIPAELDEMREGEPINSDDLIDLMLLLEQPDWLDRLTATRVSS
ncbi:MAG: hypothetical protein ACRDKS_15535 [Actinomycetota bacterium]